MFLQVVQVAFDLQSQLDHIKPTPTQFNFFSLKTIVVIFEYFFYVQETFDQTRYDAAERRSMI